MYLFIRKILDKQLPQNNHNKVDNKVNPLTALILMSLNSQDQGWLSLNEHLLRGIGINVLENEKLCQESFIRMKDIFYQESFT